MIRPEGDPHIARGDSAADSEEIEILAPHQLDDEFEKSALVQAAVAEIMTKIQAEHAAGNNRTYFDTSNHRLASVLAEKFSLFYEVKKTCYPDSYQGPGGVHLTFLWPDASCW